MSDNKASGSRLANDGYKPGLLTEGHKPLPSRGYQPQPGKIQGGYQAPGGGKPSAPTTGSGVKPPATPPNE